MPFVNISDACDLCELAVKYTLRNVSYEVWFSDLDSLQAPCTMIRLFKVKEKQREAAESADGKGLIKKQTAGELCLHKGSYLVLHSDHEVLHVYKIIYLFPFITRMNHVV